MSVNTNKKREKNITIDDLSTGDNGLSRNVNTIEDLAKMVKSEFDAENKRFDIIENHLSDIENCLVDIKLRLYHVAYRFEIEEVDKREKALEKVISKKSKR